MVASVDDLRKSAISIPVDVLYPFEFGEDAVLQVGGRRSTEPDVKKYLELARIPCHDECPGSRVSIPCYGRSSFATAAR